MVQARPEDGPVLRNVFGLAQDGKLNEKGLPSLWQIAVTVPYFGDEIRLTNPPWALQRVLFGLLSPVGRMLGYRPEYPYSHGGKEETMIAEDEQVSATFGMRAVVVTAMALAVLFALFLLRRRGHSSTG